MNAARYETVTAALRQKTVANGCTASEAQAALARVFLLKARYGHQFAAPRPPPPPPPPPPAAPSAADVAHAAYRAHEMRVKAERRRAAAAKRDLRERTLPYFKGFGVAMVALWLVLIMVQIH